MAVAQARRGLFPPNHPYHWPVIGSMEDLTAASYDDVVEFFKNWYGPEQRDPRRRRRHRPAEARRLVEKWFSDVPARRAGAPLAAPPAVLTAEKRVTLEDQVQLPRLYLAWLTPASSSRATRRWTSWRASSPPARTRGSTSGSSTTSRSRRTSPPCRTRSALVSTFLVTATAREGHGLSEIEKVITRRSTKLKNEPPATRELERAVNQIESFFYRALERVGGFGGKADRLNLYELYTGRPDYFAEDLARYTSLDSRRPAVRGPRAI